MAQWCGGAVVRWCGGAVARWRSGAVARALDSPLREPGHKSCTVMSNLGQIF